MIFQWKAIGQLQAVAAWEALGFICEQVMIPYEGRVYDEAFLRKFNRHLDENSYDMVFSLNYFPMIAAACHGHDVPYVAWCYDSPTVIGDLETLKYSTTHVFLFDSMEAEVYRELGFTKVYHMPLGVNVEYYDRIDCTPEEVRRYGASVSFVGDLYDFGFASALKHLPDYDKAYLNALVDNQFGNYGVELYNATVTPALAQRLTSPDFLKALYQERDSHRISAEAPAEERLFLQLNRLVTHRERLLLINMLSKHWDFKLYSSQSHSVLKDAIHCGRVDYYTEMPKVFRSSRMNLNVTLHSIQAGIPLRCMDIMGCHGLLLTNYQKDFEEHFKDEENLLLYHCLEEAYDKAKFYLEHETLRQKIEDSGYETVKEHYNYPSSLRKMLQKADLGHLLE